MGQLDQLQDILDELVGIVWGEYVLIPLLLLTGVYLTIRLRLVQVWTLPHALWLAFVRRKERSDVEGDISHYQALSAALAATVGVGNIAGVATAIGIGGPGALFWMWVTGVLGMATKYSEALLGVKYRQTDAKGQQSGGPMYYLTNGLGGGFGLLLGTLFALFGAIAAFGIGNGVQAGEVAGVVERTWDVPNVVTGLVLLVLAGVVILGGIKAIGRTAALLVPAMCLIYIFAAIVVLIIFVGDLGPALGMIFADAFTGTSAIGGFAGSGILLVIQMGMARGIFSNESGLGTGGIAAAAAKTTQPVRQAMVSMTQTFIDTLIVVTLTGLVLVVTGAWSDSGEEGATMTAWAFEQGLQGTGNYVVTIAVILFAFTTLLTWAYYGERCMIFLVERLGGLRQKEVTTVVVYGYRIVFVAVIFVGATTSPDIVWAFSDLANGLMALPNLIGLLLLSPILAAESRRYFGFPDWKNPEAKIPDVRD